MLIILGNNISHSFRTEFTEMAQRPWLDMTIMPAQLTKYRSDEPTFVGFAGAPESQAAANSEKFKGQDVTIVQSTATTVSESCMQILLAASTLKDNGAKTVTVAMPFAALGRQDRSFDGRVSSVASNHFARLMKQSGVDRVITSEPHSKAQTEFYYNHFGRNNALFLSSNSLFAADIVAQAGAENIHNISIGAPDGGDKPGDAGMLRAEDLRTVFNTLSGDDAIATPFSMVKGHTGINTTQIVKFTGPVTGRICAVVDDMSDSGGTLINAARMLKLCGAAQVWVYLSHPLLKAEDLEKVMKARAVSIEQNDVDAIDRFVATDTVPAFEKHRDMVIRANPDMDNRIKIISTARQYLNAIRLQPKAA